MHSEDISPCISQIVSETRTGIIASRAYLGISLGLFLGISLQISAGFSPGMTSATRKKKQK